MGDPHPKKGRKNKGIARQNHLKKIQDAYFRALSIWNDGTGMLFSAKSQGSLRRVAHPFSFIPLGMRPNSKKNWPIKNDDFPSFEELKLGWV